GGARDAGRASPDRLRGGGTTGIPHGPDRARWRASGQRPGRGARRLPDRGTPPRYSRARRRPRGAGAAREGIHAPVARRPRPTRIARVTGLAGLARLAGPARAAGLTRPGSAAWRA